MTCYLNLKFSSTLTDKDDPTGALAKGAVNPDQRQFTRVTVAQILAELDRGKVKSGGPIDVYVNVDWEARDNGTLGMRLGKKHIVHGRLVASESGAFQFEVLNVPDMVLIGMFNPSLDVAQVFGRKIGVDNEQIERDLKLWLQTVLSAVVPKALQVIVPSRN